MIDPLRQRLGRGIVLLEWCGGWRRYGAAMLGFVLRRSR